MAQMMELPLEILNAIIIILAMSCDGARDLVRASAICKMFLILATRSDILRVVNFQRMAFADDYTMHHHTNDLLCQCARAGNLASESILGKALLKDTWFWSMVLENNQPTLVENGLSSGLLHPHRLVRSFICHGSCEDIAMMRVPLHNYVISFVGFDVACAYGILYAITNMCSYEIIRLRIGSSISKAPENVENNVSFHALNNLLALLMPPPGVSHRDTVLLIFDKLFPLTPV